MAISFLASESVDNSIEFGGDNSIENYATLTMVSQGLEVAVGDPADTTNPLVHFDGAYERVLIGSTTVANTPYLRVGGAGNQSSRIELAETTTGVGKVMNYGFSFNQTGSGSNTLEIKRHSNSTTGSTIMTFARDNSNVTFAGDLTVSGGDITLGGTGRIQGIDTVSASTDAANKAYVDASVPSLTNYVTLNTAQTITGAKTFNNDVTLNNTFLTGVDKLEANLVEVTGAATSDDTAQLVVASGGADHNSIIHFTDDGGDQVNAIGSLEGNILTLASQNELVFKTNTSSILGNTNTKMTILTNGNVGIGETNPNQKLHVNGATQLGNISATVNFNTVALKVVEGTVNTGPTLGVGTVGAQAVLYSNGLYGMYTGVATNGDTWMQSQRNDTNTAAYDILLNPAGGNVGIGTDNPGAKLDVVGSAIIDGGTGVNTSGGTLIVKQKGDTVNDGIAITSSNASSHRIWKDSSGRLNIGGSSNPSSFVQDLSGNLSILGTTSAPKFYVGTASATSAWAFQARNSASTADSGLYFDSGSGELFLRSSSNTLTTRIRSSASSYFNGGNIGIGTTSPNTKLDVISGTNNGIRISATDTSNNWRDIDIRSYVSQAQANALPDGTAIFTTNPSSQTETAFSKFGGTVIQGRDDGNSSFAIRLGNGGGHGTKMFMDANGATTFSSTVQASGYKSSDGTAGITGTMTFVDKDSVTRTITYKNGLVVGVTP